MFTATINTTVSGQIGVSYSVSSSVAAGLRKSLFEAIPENSTTALLFDLDVSEVKMLAIRSDVAVKIKTNNALTPSNTFELAAGQSFLWPSGSDGLKDTLGANVSTNITSLHIVNEGPAGTLRLDAFVDPTPNV